MRIRNEGSEIKVVPPFLIIERGLRMGAPLPSNEKGGKMRTFGIILLIGIGLFTIYYFVNKKIKAAEENIKGQVSQAASGLSTSGGLGAILGTAISGLVMAGINAIANLFKKKEVAPKIPAKHLIATSYEISPGHFRSIPTAYREI